MMRQEPDNAQKYFQDGYTSQIFDEEWAEGLFPNGQFNSTQAQQMLAALNPDYAKQQFGYGVKEPTASKTTLYKNGTRVSIMNDGKTSYVYDANGNRLTGKEAGDAIKAGVQSGIQSAADEVAAKSNAKIASDERQAILKQGRAAKQMMRQTKELLDLNRIISTSGFAAAKKRALDFLGVTDADEGLFNAKAGKLILDNIRALGANPTEGERAFLERITPSISQGSKVNEAILKDMLEIQKRQSERARWLYNNPSASVDDYFFAENINDFSSNSKIDSPPVAVRQDTQVTGDTQSENKEMTLEQQLEEQKRIYDASNGQSEAKTNSRRRRAGR